MQTVMYVYRFRYVRIVVAIVDLFLALHDVMYDAITALFNELFCPTSLLSMEPLMIVTIDGTRWTYRFFSTGDYLEKKSMQCNEVAGLLNAIFRTHHFIRDRIFFCIVYCPLVLHVTK